MKSEREFLAAVYEKKDRLVQKRRRRNKLLLSCACLVLTGSAVISALLHLPGSKLATKGEVNMFSGLSDAAGEDASSAATDQNESAQSVPKKESIYPELRISFSPAQTNPSAEVNLPFTSIYSDMEAPPDMCVTFDIPVLHVQAAETSGMFFADLSEPAKITAVYGAAESDIAQDWDRLRDDKYLLAEKNSLPLHPGDVWYYRIFVEYKNVELPYRFIVSAE